jgi:hypothetical protein
LSCTCDPHAYASSQEKVVLVDLEDIEARLGTKLPQRTARVVGLIEDGETHMEATRASPDELNESVSQAPPRADVHPDRGHHFSKPPRDQIVLVEGHGVNGDAHAGPLAGTDTSPGASPGFPICGRFT